MSDPDPIVVPAAAPATAPAPARGTLGWLVALVLLAVALALAANASWRVWRNERTHGATLAAESAAREANTGLIEQQGAQIATLRRELDTMSRRVADAEGVNRSLREELLGIGERASLLEDAVTSLADRRMAGAVALRLNEAEFLLRLGQERLAMFGDTAATIAAFQLADAELSDLDDPMFAGVRQTLAAELADLRRDPAPGAEAVRRIDAVARALATLPARRAPAANDAAPAVDAGWSDRALHELAQFVRIRRLDPAGTAMVNPLNAELARGAVSLELVLARAGIAAGDLPRARAALDRAAERLDTSFDAGNDAVAAQRAELVAIGRMLETVAPPTLGRTLAELRNLRATRALAAPVAADAAPPPAEPAAEPTATPETSPSPAAGDGGTP